ncbi:uncharacterized domain 1-containing protein [Paracoccus saliphilus]|uniref:Uncharacterized domain 1-containing protein n=2 Tax=Paracoccus saliphilus TaxID=405559 RepID=A0AA45W555_9RHOB|nr:uncharacterized domain 1-containing protein [Paracoccus saliphilus]
MHMDEVEDYLVEDPYPLQTHLGYRITGWSRDWARFEMPIRPYLENRHGIPHGGIYSMLLDTVMGYAGCYTGDPERKRMGMTLSLTTTFLSRPAGQILIAEGRRIGGGRSTFFAEGKITDETGEDIATGNGVFRYRKSA